MTKSINSRPADSAEPDLREILQFSGDSFIQAAYWVSLDRETDIDGLQFYKKRLLEGVSKLQILGEIASSQEAKSRGVSIPGLRKALRHQRWLDLPLLGPVLDLLRPASRRKALGMQMQSLEAHTEYGLQDLQNRLAEMDRTLSELRSAIHHLASLDVRASTRPTAAGFQPANASLDVPHVRYDASPSMLTGASPLELASIQRRRQGLP